MQFFYSAALVAASQPLLASAAYLPVRHAPRAGSITALYTMPNVTSGMFGSTGMVRSTGLVTATGALRATSRTTPRATSKKTSKTTSKTTSQTTSQTQTSDQPAATASGNSPGNSSSSTNSTANAPGPISGLGLDAPVWNLNNQTCQDLAFLNASAQWNAVDGDQVVTTFQNMFENNLLLCPECFGLAKSQCTSTDDRCSQGLRDLAVLPGSSQPRWDTAAARFALDADVTDLQCTIQTGVCEDAPDCNSCNGPGSFALLKSLEVMDNALMNTYNAIQEAGSHCTDQMTAFSSTFAPIPPMQDEAMMLGILTAVVGGLLGFIPGVGGVVAGLLVGVGSSVGMDMFYFNQPGPADTSSVLGMIVNATAQQYVDVGNALFQSGTYTYTNADGEKGADISLQNLMMGGALMQSAGGANDLFNALVPTYELILYQQLAFFTWQNMEKDKKKHTPFIVFADKPCNQVSSNDKGFGNGDDDILSGVPGIDSSITYNGTCYWLLDGTETTQMNFGYREEIPEELCGIGGALPGATAKEFTSNSAIFAGLSLEDFIIPSVNGWAKNGKHNDYEVASSNGQLVSDPRAAGAVNIPVCDYIGNPSMPGVRCPKLGTAADNKGCDTWPLNAINNKPGAYVAGWCRVHVDQYQRNEGNENPLDVYQLDISVFDNDSREVGDATKQPAGSPLAVQGSLPYQLIAAPGAGDDDPVMFWYADQYWDSNSKNNQCSVGKYNNGMRQMDCGFECPYDSPSNNPTASATHAHKLPSAPTEAAVGASSFINTFYQSTTAPAGASATPTAAPKPTYAQGWCGVHVRQHQKNEPDNQSPNYAIEVTIYDAKHKAIGDSGQVQAPEGKPVDVAGLIKPFTVTAEAVDSDPLKFSYNGQNWDSNSKQCSVGRYDSGHRDMDCGFTC